MTSITVEQIGKVNSDRHAVEKAAETDTGTPTKSAGVVGQAAKSSRDTINKSAADAIAGFKDLTEAYQALARRNTEKLTASIQALAAVKTPMEFVALQQKLLAEGVAAAVSDSTAIAKLTTAAFTAAFKPVRKQVEAMQGGLKP